MNLRSEANREAEVGERLEEEIRTIIEEDRNTWIEISHIKREKVKLKGINDLNYMNVDIPDIQGTIAQKSGLQPSSGAQSPDLNARLRLKDAGSISANIMERTDPQINEGHEDNAEEEEDEQTYVAALIQNKDYRVNIISQPPVQENMGTQPQNDQGLNTLSQMEKDDTDPAPVGVQEKPKNGKGSKKSKTEGLNISDEQSQGCNTQAQTKTTFKLPKPKSPPKRGWRKIRIGTLQTREISVEISFWNREDERADDDGSSGDRRKD
ncbi:MAG: hypothetical protein EZS28_001298 [Streblomastix strix]|uniref:Uncharacterized protein n=1 Tax=Streblomastix strix TaxID=222440 RepID=A0A5J4X8I5_9EUKA|nr:MAG: hypothetical protein EZS28_001298 [Streblomastix strix]